MNKFDQTRKSETGNRNAKFPARSAASGRRKSPHFRLPPSAFLLLILAFLLPIFCAQAQKISQLPAASSAGDPDLLAIVQGGTTKRITIAALFSSIDAVTIGAVPGYRAITAGTGLSGGGDLSANQTISLADTAVTPGSYGSSGQSVSITVDQQGRITDASANNIAPGDIGAAPGYRTITAGTGLTGGGDLTANRTITLADTAVTPGSYGSASKSVTISVDQQGRITSAADATITPTGIGALKYEDGVGTLWNHTRKKIGSGQIPMPFYSANNWLQIAAADNPSFVLTNTNTGVDFGVTASNASDPYAPAGGYLQLVISGNVANYIYLSTTGIYFGQPLVVPGASFTGTVAYSDLKQAQAAITPYAVFDIELGGGFTDFELKGSPNNWADDDMAFFYHSPDPGKSIITQQVWTTRPDVYFTDSQFVGSPASRNQRTWRKQTATQSIAAMRTNGNSVVAGAMLYVKDAITPETAANYSWSYCRMTPTGYEEDAGGKSIWRPIAPKWVSAIPTIAQ